MKLSYFACAKCTTVSTLKFDFGLWWAKKRTDENQSQT